MTIGEDEGEGDGSGETEEAGVMGDSVAFELLSDVLDSEEVEIGERLGADNEDSSDSQP